MKILQLIYESLNSPFGFGGAGVRAYKIYEHLKDRHDITLLCMKYPGARDSGISGLRHVFAGSESRHLTTSVLSYTIQAARYVRKYGKDFDIIVENFLPATPFFSKYFTDTPVVLQIQGIMGLHSVRKFNPLYGIPLCLMEKIYPMFYDNYICVTEVVPGALQRKGVRMSVIPNGVDRALLEANTQNTGDYILFFSRIDTYTKGIDILIDAFHTIAERFKDIRLVLAGYEFNKAADLLEELPGELRERVFYAGFLSGEDKVRLLAKAKVFVLPSRHEAHPISVLEALACARPVVVSDIPELSYVAQNNAGLTFKSGSSRDLAGRITALLEDEALRQRLGKEGRRYASQFLWDEIALRFEDVLYEVIRGKE